MTASFVARAPQIRDRIGVTVGEFGLFLTVASLFGLLGSVLAGRIVHAATTRRVLQAGAVVMVLSLPVIGFGLACATGTVARSAATATASTNETDRIPLDSEAGAPTFTAVTRLLRASNVRPT